MESSRPSKTKQKKQMEELQNIGKALVDLPKDVLKKLDLPESLRNEVLDAKNIAQNGAKRRQLQFIGKIMRKIEVEPIRAQLEQLKQPSAREVKFLHATESWREKIINSDNGYKEFINIYPTADSSKLEELISSCRGPTNSKSKSSYRRLFKLIASCLEDKEE